MNGAERDKLASDLAVPITQIGGLLCGMKKYTGASGTEWAHWIACLEGPLNEIGAVFEAVLDGQGDYERVVDRDMVVRELREGRAREAAILAIGAPVPVSLSSEGEQQA